jgi:uncharacterized cupredoxin-like copper-binding protein
MGRVQRWGAVAVLVLTGLGLGACSSDSDSGFTVTEKDFSVKPSGAEVTAGKVTVTVHNRAKQEHELVVFRTDLDEAKLPLNATKDRVDEEAKGITHLDPEAEGVKAGKSKTITIELPAGRYVFICNLTGHYGQGMHAVVTAT